MNKLLSDLITSSKNGDDDALLEIIYRFIGTINKFSKQLKYDGARSDLIISLIEIIKELDLSNVHTKNDGAIVNFIYRSLFNKKVDLYRKSVYEIKEELDENIELIPDRSYTDIETKIIIKDMLKALSKLQRDVLLLRYYGDYSDKEIAEKFKISRQAVYKIRNRGLKKLKEIVIPQDRWWIHGEWDN